jgi:hypothetical protein
MSDLLTIVNHRNGHVPLQSTGYDAARRSPGSAAAGSPAAAGQADVLELSDAAQRAERPDADSFRQGVVDRVRGEVQRGTYLSDNKLDHAIERLYRELLG